MRTSTSLRTAASLTLCGLVIAACGQKPGVRVDGDGQPGGQALAGQQQVVDDGIGGTDDTTGTGGDITTDGASVSPGDTSGSTAGGETTGGGGTTGGQQTTGGGGGGDSTGGETTGGNEPTGGGGDSTDDGGGGGTAQTQGNDRTGAGENQIVVGVHAPVSGAAPLPTTSFEQARQTYWNYIIEKKGETVLGRESVEVIFRDDQYNPSRAQQVCNEMASKAFLLAGGGGTDQIQRCGQRAKVSEFPYFSAGVTEAGLHPNPWYFAASMTYRQQGGLLAQYVAKNPDGIERLGANAKIGTIITDTANFKDAEQGWLQGLADNGLQNTDIYRHPKGDTSWYAAAAEEFAAQDINVVYILTSPVDYLQFANTAEERYGYNPQYIGVGVSMGLNAVLGSGCPDASTPEKNIGSGIFMSPFYGLDYARENNPIFFEESERQGRPQDDIALALWGLAEGQHALFQGYGEVFGNDLTREDFRAFVEGGAGTVENSVYPSVTYSPDNHFGASAAHFLKADCSDADNPEYVTLRADVSGF